MIRIIKFIIVFLRKQFEQSSKVNSQNGNTCQKEINSTSSNKNDIRSALLGALDRIKKDVRSSEYYLCETDSSSDDEWMD